MTEPKRRPGSAANIRKWHQELPTDFADRLRHLRASDSPAFSAALIEALDAGWTQRAVAKALGVHFSVVNRLAKHARPDHGLTVPPPPERAKRRPGRPKTTGPTPSRSMRLGPVYDQAKAKAEANGVTITAVVERLLTEYLAEDAQP